MLTYLILAVEVEPQERYGASVAVCGADPCVPSSWSTDDREADGCEHPRHAEGGRATKTRR